MTLYRYTVNVEYIGTVEVDPDTDGPFATDDDLNEYVEELALDDYAHFGRASVNDLEVEAVKRWSNESKWLHFACDRCMNKWGAYRASDCPACKHKSIWEFDNERNRDQFVHDHERLFVRHVR